MAQSKPLSPSADERRAAAGQYDRANQVIANGDHDYGIKLLKNCCLLDPANMIYRRALRGTQKLKHNNNLRGSRLASVTTASIKLRMRKARMEGNHRKVLKYGEDVLTHNPWDIGAQMAMASAFDDLGLLEPAVWTLEDARQKAPTDLKLNRKLARMYEKTGQFTHANALWALIWKADPRDEEAQRKVKDIAASETISRGNYEAVLQTQNHALDETQQNEKLDGDEDDAPLSPFAAKLAHGERGQRELDDAQKRIDAEPRNPQNYLQLAKIYRRREQWEEARDTLAIGLQAAGNDFELAVELADVDIQTFRADLSATEAKLDQSPEDENLNKFRHKLQKEINTRELDLYRQKADRYPTDMSYRLEMGIRLLQLGQVDEAISQLQLARTDPRGLWKALMNLGFCFKTRNNWRLAQRNFEDALRQLPPAETERRKEVLYQLAHGCANAGDTNAAIEWGYELANEDFAYKRIGQLLDEWQNAAKVE